MKLGATLAALTAGAINRQIVTARMESDPDGAKQWPKRTLAVEAIAFGIAIVAVSLATTVWLPAHA